MQIFNGLLSSSLSLTTKCMSLNNNWSTTRLTVIHLDPVKFNYYLFVISLDKCDRSCNNAVGDLSAKACVPTNTKGVNIKVLNIITRINEAKMLVKHLSYGCKC